MKSPVYFVNRGPRSRGRRGANHYKWTIHSRTTQSALDHRLGSLGGIPQRQLLAARCEEEGEMVRKGEEMAGSGGNQKLCPCPFEGAAGDNIILCSWCYNSLGRLHYFSSTHWILCCSIPLLLASQRQCCNILAYDQPFERAETRTTRQWKPLEQTNGYEIKNIHLYRNQVYSRISQNRYVSQTPHGHEWSRGNPFKVPSGWPSIVPTI